MWGVSILFLNLRTFYRVLFLVRHGGPVKEQLPRALRFSNYNQDSPATTPPKALLVNSSQFPLICQPGPLLAQISSHHPGDELLITTLSTDLSSNPIKPWPLETWGHILTWLSDSKHWSPVPNLTFTDRRVYTEPRSLPCSFLGPDPCAKQCSYSCHLYEPQLHPFRFLRPR